MLGFYWVLIIPKLLIKVPGAIAILFRWFLELLIFYFTVLYIFDYWNMFKKCKKLWKHVRTILSVHISSFCKSKMLTFFGHHRTPTYLKMGVSCFVLHPKNYIHLRSCSMEFPQIRFGIFSKPHYFWKMQKQRQFLMGQTYFWNSIDHFDQIPDPRGFLVFSIDEFVGPHGFLVFSGNWIFESLGFPRNQNLPQNTDSHPCIRPGWSRSLHW